MNLASLLLWYCYAIPDVISINVLGKHPSIGSGPKLPDAIDTYYIRSLSKLQNMLRKQNVPDGIQNAEWTSSLDLKLTAHCSPLTAHRSSLTAHRSPLIAHCSPLIAHRSSLTAHRSPLIAHRSLLNSVHSVSSVFAYPAVDIFYGQGHIFI